MSDLGNAATGEGEGATGAAAQPSEQTPQTTETKPADTGGPADNGQQAGEGTEQQPAGDELTPKGKEEVRARFEAMAQKQRELQEQLRQRDEFIKNLTNPGPPTTNDDGIYPELVGLPVDGIGQVNYQGQWLPPEIAVQLARQQNATNEMLKFVGQMQTTQTMEQVKASHDQMVKDLEGEVSRMRGELIPNLPEGLGHLTDFVIGALVNQAAHDENGNFDPLAAYNAIPEMAKVVKEQLGHFGNLQLQAQAAAANGAVVTQTGGGVAAPGQKPLHELNPNDRNKVLDDLGNRALARARGGT